MYNKNAKHTKNKNSKKWQNLLILLFMVALIIPISFSKYTEMISETLNLSIRKPSYTIKFYSNRNDGNQDEEATQTFIYGTKQNLRKNTFINGVYYFKEWTTNADGTGNKYSDEQEVNNLTDVDGEEIELYAQWTSSVAEIDGVFYSTLQGAIDAVPKDNTQTTVKLLTNVSENLSVVKDQNIIFDFQNHTISITTGAIITNKGTISISNGTLTSSSTTDGGINNEEGAKITISGGRILMTAEGGKQALYNNKGTVEITGSAYLRNASKPSVAGKNVRAAVQNVSPGTMTITGGTIISEYYYGVNSNGAITIGTEDNDPDRTTPVIQGGTIGVNCTANYSFYNGIIKGKQKAVNDINKITAIETGYQLANGEEEIDSETYTTMYLALTRTVTFNANGGSVSEGTRNVENGNKVGTLPVPQRVGYRFDGWFTESTGGVEVTKDTIINSDVTFFAHWTKTTVAEFDGVEYNSLQQAINQVPKDNTESIVKLIYDTQETVLVSQNQNIILNLQNYTLSNSTKKQVIVNKGTLKIYNGEINQAGGEAAINNEENGHLYISGGTINSTAGKASIYNKEGTVEISGNAQLISNASGITTDSLERGTVQNLVNGTVSITGGTIVGTAGHAISNYGILTLGVEDGNINTSSPNIRGEAYGVKNFRTFNYYDGIIKGINGAINGTITSQEQNTQTVDDTETIDGKTYLTVHLEANV